MLNKLIIIEGTDGTGKTTQVALLKELLEAKDYKVKTVKFPNYATLTGKLVTRYLKNEFGDASTLDPILSCALYALDRAVYKNQLVRDIEEHDYVILDRYYYSNIALQGAKENVDFDEVLEFVIDTEVKGVGLPGGTVVWLNSNSELNVAARLKDRKGKDSGTGLALDGHESNEAYMTNVDLCYVKMAKHFGFINIELVEENGNRKTPICIANEIARIVT